MGGERRAGGSASVSMTQARLALLAAGKLAAVDRHQRALQPGQEDEAQIWWEYSSHVERQHPYVLQLAPALDLGCRWARRALCSGHWHRLSIRRKRDMKLDTRLTRLRHIIAAGILAAAASVALAQQDPFTPARGANTTNVAATSAAATLTLPTTIAGLTRQVVITTIGSQIAFFLCDGTSTSSPTTATVSNAQPAMPYTAFILTLPSSITACSVIAAASGSTVYATVGFGR
jgi:hypothetical protein